MKAADVRYRQRWHSGSPSGVNSVGARIVVPDDVERFEHVPAPCFNCESRGPCRHRPWMLGS